MTAYRAACPGCCAARSVAPLSRGPSFLESVGPGSAAYHKSAAPRPGHDPSPRLHRPIGMAGLRHAPIERHVRVRAQPAVAIP